MIKPKIIYLALFVLISGSGLFVSSGASAYFNDTESVETNDFHVETLDMSVAGRTSGFEPADAAQRMAPANSVSRDIIVKRKGSLSFQYAIRTEIVSGDMDFCNSLNFAASLRESEKYRGSLAGFDFENDPIKLGARPEDIWSFSVVMPNDGFGELQGKTCRFKIAFKAWQENLPNSKVGFSAVEEIENVLISGDWTGAAESIDASSVGEAAVDNNTTVSANSSMADASLIVTNNATSEVSSNSIVNFQTTSIDNAATINASVDSVVTTSSSAQGNDAGSGSIVTGNSTKIIVITNSIDRIEQSDLNSDDPVAADSSFQAAGGLSEINPSQEVSDFSQEIFDSDPASNSDQLANNIDNL